MLSRVKGKKVGKRPTSSRGVDDDHLEELPKRTKMRPAKQYWDARSEAKITPITRFLHSCTGMLWDDVWSQICDRFDARSKDGIFVRETAKSLVTFDAERVGNRYVDTKGDPVVTRFAVYNGVLRLVKTSQSSSY